MYFLNVIIVSVKNVRRTMHFVRVGKTCLLTAHVIARIRFAFCAGLALLSALACYCGIINSNSWLPAHSGSTDVTTKLHHYVWHHV